MGPLGLALFVGFVTALPWRSTDRGADLVFFGALEERGLPAWIMLPLIFLAVAAIMAAIVTVARRFARFEALDAYRLDILGSSRDPRRRGSHSSERRRSRGVR